MFLISIVTRSHEVEEDKAICVAALRHAASFLTAQSKVDFQTILPSLIVAISGPDADIRAAAMDCVAIVASHHQDLTSVYGFDTIYGQKSGTYRGFSCYCLLIIFSGDLQYLDVADVLNYVKCILHSKDHIIQDGNYFKIFHQQHLTRDKSDSKADAKFVLRCSRPFHKINETVIRYKQRILSYLLSHVHSIGLSTAKIALLKTTEDISNEVKAQVLLPAIQELVQHSLVVHFGPCLEEYTTLVVSSFDKSSSEALNEQSSTSWPVFISILRHFFQSGVPINDTLLNNRTHGNIPASLHAPQMALGHNLEHGLFAALSPDRQLEICTELLQIGAHDPNAVYYYHRSDRLTS